MPEVRKIATLYSDFNEKFGIPRQSGLVNECISKIVFEEEYRDENYIRGIEKFSHLWLIWQFSENVGKSVSPTVRPPKLGGNIRMGVFATRSPFRPNFMGLSSVKLEGVKKDGENGMVLLVSGADIKNGTPVFDIKPYLSYTDSHPDAICGFTDEIEYLLLEIVDPDNVLDGFGKEFAEKLKAVLSQDPRPSYHSDPDRIYKMTFDSKEVSFSVNGKTLILISITG